MDEQASSDRMRTDSADADGRRMSTVGSDSEEGKKVSLGQALLALVASGMVGVFGPQLGQMYHEGYLGAFGLTAQEFPATDVEIRSYAFFMVALAADSIWTETLRLWPLLGALVIGGSVLVAVSRTRWVLRMRRQLAAFIQGPAEHESRGRAVAWHAAWGGGFGLLYALSVLLMMMLLAGAIAVVVSPVLARSAGAKQGAKELADYARSPGAGTDRCDSLQASVPFACAHVVVVGKDTLAVYDRERIYRVQRAGTGLVTAVPRSQKASQPR